MATEKKIPRQATKRSVSYSSVATEQLPTNVSFQAATEWSNSHEFLSPNEINPQAIGLLFCLTTKRLINIPFTNLYCRSLRLTWLDLLIRERRNLKSNINSVQKCFALNRLITECTKDPCKFAQQTGELYEEIKSRMSSALLPTWTSADFYNQIQNWRELQYQRRLFHISHDGRNQPQRLLSLQRMANILFTQLLDLYRANPTVENYNQLRQLLWDSFIIVAQPSIPECVAATKYEKSDNIYTAKLFARIICLLDPDLTSRHMRLPNVGVTLYPFDRTVDQLGEDQEELEWHSRIVADAAEQQKSIRYVELESIELNKLDTRTLRPVYSAKLCQLQFQIKIHINGLPVEEPILLLSQPFGLCSHAQYYPEYVAKILLHEVARTSDHIIEPNVLTNCIARYHTRITGVEMKLHTTNYITEILHAAYEERKNTLNATSSDIYEEILAKIVSQMEMFIDYPFLSMMYHDGLFLGICNATLDQQLCGTRENPHILLRFNSLSTHQSTQHPSVRFIVHNGKLTRATFHARAFVDEVCRMICEANSDRAKMIRLLSESSDRSFHEFSSYFDNELYRLHPAACPLNYAYQPFIPVLWNTMRTTTDLTEPQLYSPASNVESTLVNFSQASASPKDEIQINLADLGMLTDQSKSSDEKVIIPTDMLIHHVVEKLSDILLESSTENLSSSSSFSYIDQVSILLRTLTGDNLQQQKHLLSHLLHDFFQSQTHVDVSTQISTPELNNSPTDI